VRGETRLGRTYFAGRRVLSRARTRARRRREDRKVEQGRAQRLREIQRSSNLLLDVGASSSHLAGWISLDIAPDERSLRLDASRPWPLRDGSARAVRAEHMLEHLTWEGAETCVREMYRVLEPGGVVRICTPDLEGIARAYLERDPHVLEVHREHGYDAPTWSHLPNNYLRLWGHRHVFDLDSLRAVLELAGFTEIERTGFNRSRHRVLDGTDSHDPGDLEPLVVCVDAVKPG
jgi:predicted SAM-dependent methyltransferase